MIDATADPPVPASHVPDQGTGSRPGSRPGRSRAAVLTTIAAPTRHRTTDLPGIRAARYGTPSSDRAIIRQIVRAGRWAWSSAGRPDTTQVSWSEVTVGASATEVESGSRRDHEPGAVIAPGPPNAAALGPVVFPPGPHARQPDPPSGYIGTTSRGWTMDLHRSPLGRNARGPAVATHGRRPVGAFHGSPRLAVSRPTAAARQRTPARDPIPGGFQRSAGREEPAGPS